MYVRPRPEAQLSTCSVTVKDEDVDGITEIGMCKCSFTYLCCKLVCIHVQWLLVTVFVLMYVVSNVLEVNKGFNTVKTLGLLYPHF